MDTIKEISEEIVINKILFIRGKKVMLDKDLAEMYGVLTKRLNEQVKRNIKRFPSDFMFQLTKEEAENLISQNAISSSKIKTKNLKSQIATSSYGGTRKLPYAFTEQGVAMLSSVLNSDTAIDVNIKIIRIFTKMRELLLDNKDILLKLEQLERKVSKQDIKVNKHEREMEMIFSAIKEL
ncbi:MAG: ORF6N domain-containing protein [Saprospirales bacterium]|nr:ORF6N domain-containing protein [Saprospirales bacterium]